LIGEGLYELDLLVRERLDLELVKDDDADDVITSEHRNAKFRADWIAVSPRVAILRVCLKIRNMNRSSFERHSRGNAVASRCDGVALYEIDEFRGDVVERCPIVGVTVPSHDNSAPRRAEPRRILDESVEDGLKVECRPTDDLQDLGGRRLLLKGLVQAARDF